MLYHSLIFFAFALLLSGNRDTLFSLERGSAAPFISGDTFRAYADHVLDETTSGFNPGDVKLGDIVFVKTDWEYLEDFFSNYHPQITVPYILLTHNSDHGAPGPFKSYLDDPKILAWFAQNVEDDSHPKLHPIPIGIANKCHEHGNMDVFSTYLHLSRNDDRPFLGYLNFHDATYPKERTYVRCLFSKHPWCVGPKNKALSRYLKDLSRSKFVFSPRGNGLDCHRTWEALLLGAIPIVRASTLDSLYKDLPVLIVEEWRTVTESYLNEQYEAMKLKKYDFEKLFISYWLNQIRPN